MEAYAVLRNYVKDLEVTRLPLPHTLRMDREMMLGEKRKLIGCADAMDLDTRSWAGQ